jgi:hypothetical protein
MPRSDARNVKPSLSDAPRDKLAAALGWHYGQFKQSREYQIAPIYFDMLVEWHEKTLIGTTVTVSGQRSLASATTR